MRENGNNDRHFQPDTNDDIDLLELCATLWRRKWLIFATMAAIIIPTLIWLVQQQPIYRLEVQFDSTSNNDIQPLQPTSLVDGSPYKVEKLKSKDFYQTFLMQIGALKTKKLFWEHWTKMPLSADPIAKAANDVLFKKFLEALVLTPPNPKNLDSTISHLTLETSQPAKDIEMLTEYIEYANKRVIDKFVLQLEKAYSARLQQLNVDYEMLLKREKQKLQDNLLQLHEGLNIAQSLKIIETPYEQLTGVELTVIDGRHYLLGSRVLSEEIKSLEARIDKPLGAFVPELRQMEYVRETIKADLNRLQLVKDNIPAFYLASAATSSIDPVKPKKLLILLGATFLSLLLGMVIVFVTEGVRSYHARSYIQ